MPQIGGGVGLSKSLSLACEPLNRRDLEIGQKNKLKETEANEDMEEEMKIAFSEGCVDKKCDPDPFYTLRSN